LRYLLGRRGIAAEAGEGKPIETGKVFLEEGFERELLAGEHAAHERPIVVFSRFHGFPRAHRLLPRIGGYRETKSFASQREIFLGR
jgi:hypothetical protein